MILKKRTRVAIERKILNSVATSTDGPVKQYARATGSLNKKP
jgi:hypothetical protein